MKSLLLQGVSNKFNYFMNFFLHALWTIEKNIGTNGSSIKTEYICDQGTTITKKRGDT